MAVTADVLFGASGLTGVVVGNRVATKLIRRHRTRPHQRTPAEIQAHIEALEIDLGMRRACVECGGSTAAGFFGRETEPVCRTCYESGQIPVNVEHEAWEDTTVERRQRLLRERSLRNTSSVAFVRSLTQQMQEGQRPWR